MVNATFDLEGQAEADGPAIFGALAQGTCELGRESEGQCILGTIAAAAVGCAKDLHERAVEPFDPPYSVGAEGDGKYDMLACLNGKRIPRLPIWLYGNDGCGVFKRRRADNYLSPRSASAKMSFSGYSCSHFRPVRMKSQTVGLQSPPSSSGDCKNC